MLQRAHGSVCKLPQFDHCIDCKLNHHHCNSSIDSRQAWDQFSQSRFWPNLSTYVVSDPKVQTRFRPTSDTFSFPQCICTNHSHLPYTGPQEFTNDSRCRYTLPPFLSAKTTYSYSLPPTHLQDPGHYLRYLSMQHAYRKLGHACTFCKLQLHSSRLCVQGCT